MIMYTASVNIAGRKYKGSGASVIEAIANIKLGGIKGRGILTLSKGVKSKDRILSPIAMNRLFQSHGMLHDVQLKNTSLLFQGFDT